MARAFFASVPLALALVAAVVVPVALTPGTFGFKGWPTDTHSPAPVHSVATAPERVQVAEKRSRPAADPRPHVAKSHSAARPPRQLAAAPVPARRAPVRVPATQQESGPGASVAPVPAPAAPADPAPAPASPAPAQPADDGEAEPETPVVAAGPTPVLREDLPPAAAPEPVAAPLRALLDRAPLPRQDARQSHVAGRSGHRHGRRH